MTKKLHFAGYVLNSVDGRLTVDRQTVRPVAADHGADPLPDGTFRMVPSGDIVSFDERCKRLATRL